MQLNIRQETPADAFTQMLQWNGMGRFVLDSECWLSRGGDATRTDSKQYCVLVLALERASFV